MTSHNETYLKQYMILLCCKIHHMTSLQIEQVQMVGLTAGDVFLQSDVSEYQVVKFKRAQNRLKKSQG